MDEIIKTDAAERSADETIEKTHAPELSAPADAAETVAPSPENTANEAPDAPQNSPSATRPMQNKAEIIARLEAIAADGGRAERAELDGLKQAYYRLHQKEAAEERAAYIEAHGSDEGFLPSPDAEEQTFKDSLSKVRELRAAAAAEEEALKQRNLERKLQIIEEVKAMTESAEKADKSYEAFKALQAEWKTLSPVPAERATELWKTYQAIADQFYDLLSLCHELRDYDYRKNLETKTRLCEQAEQLAGESDVVSAFHALQKLHQEFRETGPVAKEHREEIWNRFKEASTLVNKAHQAHFERLKAEEEQNLERKTALCEQAEAIAAATPENSAGWEQGTQAVIALQAEWKTIGFTPKKVNTQIFERFRSACDAFFTAKSEHFRATRESLAQNLAAKTALAEKADEIIAAAEAFAAQNEWESAAARIIDLQRKWKQIGTVPRKVSTALWERFNGTCNRFFELKSAAGPSRRQEEEANFDTKRGIIERLEALAAEMGDDALQKVRELQKAWNETGHVPFRKKDKLYEAYRSVCDKIYDALHESAGRRSVENFKRRVAETAGNDLQREYQRMVQALEQKRAEIKTYETNLSFFSGKSKAAASLVGDIEKKISRLREDAEQIAEKVKAAAAALREEKKAE